ncbi:MAG: hypothetical protein WC455_02190 [Dehalococcoidia bacterium]|jgi:hypothetical protein
MSEIKEILQSQLKPKEKLTSLVEAVTKKKITAKEFIQYFKSASDTEKGTCADAMKHISKDKPEILAPYINELIDYINYDVPRVKWGVPEAIGNMSKRYPKEVEKAIPNLLTNTNDKSTVIRWCAAYGLTEIAKNNDKTRKKLVPLFESMVKKENNNGVRNVYVKAIRFIEKGEK